MAITKNVADRLREAVSDGVVLDLRIGDPEVDDAKGSKAWGEGRTIAAGQLVELISTRSGDSTPLKPLHLIGANIVGDLVLEGLQLERLIVLQDCRLNGALNLRETSLVSLRLPGCVIGGIDGRNLRARGTIELDQGFASNAPVDLTGASVDGELVCIGGEFSPEGGPALSLMTASVRGGVFCGSGFTAHGEVLADDARIGGQFICSRGNFLNPGGIALSIDRAIVSGSVHCKEGFTAEGEVRMLGVSISGPLVCTGGAFHNPGDMALSADRASIQGGVFFDKQFVANGQVRVPGARIGGQFNCDDGHFHNAGDIALTLDSAVIEGNLYCDGDFTAKGKISIRAASLHRHVAWQGGYFEDPGDFALIMEGSDIAGSLLFGKEFTAKGLVGLDGVKIGGRLLFAGKISSDGAALDLEGARIAKDLILTPSESLAGWIDLTNAQVNHVVDCPEAWGGGYELSGLRYQTLKGTPEKVEKSHWWERNPALRARLTWLKQNRGGYQPQIYDQLANSYEQAGLDSQRRQVLIEKQRRGRQHLAMPAKLWSVVEDALVGFGYRTWRAVIPFAALLIFGLFFFGEHRHEIVPKNSTLETPDFHPFIYTLDLLVPVVTLGLRESYTARGIAQTVSTIYVVAGWVLTTAIIAALTGLLRRVD